MAMTVLNCTGVNTVDKNLIQDAVTVMETNVLGVIAISSAFLPGMKARGEGHVINIGEFLLHTDISIFDCMLFFRIGCWPSCICHWYFSKLT